MVLLAHNYKLFSNYIISVVLGNVIHIGSAYQATCPELISSCTPCPASVPEKALLVWKPEPHISDVSLENYITLAKEKYGYVYYVLDSN